MLKKRIIPCLDVKNGSVVKGIQFKSHVIIGDMVKLAEWYTESGADELVFYDITASAEHRVVDTTWIDRIAQSINIPFCVSGGISTLFDAEKILNAGADKISINSPALLRPDFINELSQAFGTQCVVVGIDSLNVNDEYIVFQYTGSEKTIRNTGRKTKDWIREVQDRGAGEIVLNCMNQDGMKTGYDIQQLRCMKQLSTVPLIASGGAGSMQDFYDVFHQTGVDGALAASVFHQKEILICELKQFLMSNNVEVRL